MAGSSSLYLCFRVRPPVSRSWEVCARNAAGRRCARWCKVQDRYDPNRYWNVNENILCAASPLRRQQWHILEGIRHHRLLDRWEQGCSWRHATACAAILCWHASFHSMHASDLFEPNRMEAHQSHDAQPLSHGSDSASPDPRPGSAISRESSLQEKVPAVLLRIPDLNAPQDASGETSDLRPQQAEAHTAPREESEEEPARLWQRSVILVRQTNTLLQTATKRLSPTVILSVLATAGLSLAVLIFLPLGRGHRLAADAGTASVAATEAVKQPGKPDSPDSTKAGTSSSPRESEPAKQPAVPGARTVAAEGSPAGKTAAHAAASAAEPAVPSPQKPPRKSASKPAEAPVAGKESRPADASSRDAQTANQSPSGVEAGQPHKSPTAGTVDLDRATAAQHATDRVRRLPPINRTGDTLGLESTPAPAGSDVRGTERSHGGPMIVENPFAVTDRIASRPDDRAAERVPASFEGIITRPDYRAQYDSDGSRLH